MIRNKGEAPLEVTFTDKSVRGYNYKWEFGDGKDSISDLSTPQPHIYYKPGEYSVKLTIESELHCIDSMRFDKIVVDPSKLDIPNVFTPNGDGLNDNFIVDSRSLRNISVVIFSRSGMKVYFSWRRREAPRLDRVGRECKYHHLPRQARVYTYYIIRAYGWDDVKYTVRITGDLLFVPVIVMQVMQVMQVVQVIMLKEKAHDLQDLQDLQDKKLLPHSNNKSHNSQAYNTVK